MFDSQELKASTGAQVEDLVQQVASILVTRGAGTAETHWNPLLGADLRHRLALLEGAAAVLLALVQRKENDIRVLTAAADDARDPEAWDITLGEQFLVHHELGRSLTETRALAQCVRFVLHLCDSPTFSLRCLLPEPLSLPLSNIGNVRHAQSVALHSLSYFFPDVLNMRFEEDMLFHAAKHLCASMSACAADSDWIYKVAASPGLVDATLASLVDTPLDASILASPHLNSELCARRIGAFLLLPWLCCKSLPTEVDLGACGVVVQCAQRYLLQFALCVASVGHVTEEGVCKVSSQELAALRETGHALGEAFGLTRAQQTLVFALWRCDARVDEAAAARDVCRPEILPLLDADLVAALALRFVMAGHSKALSCQEDATSLSGVSLGRGSSSPRTESIGSADGDSEMGFDSPVTSGKGSSKSLRTVGSGKSSPAGGKRASRSSGPGVDVRGDVRPLTAANALVSHFSLRSPSVATCWTQPVHSALLLALSALTVEDWKVT